MRTVRLRGDVAMQSSVEAIYPSFFSEIVIRTKLNYGPIFFLPWVCKNETSKQIMSG